MLNKKCVIVINQELGCSPMANTAAVLSLSLGKHFPQLIGEDLRDHVGHRRQGITTVAIAVLKSSESNLGEMREALKSYESDLTVIDLTADTQSTRSYQEYAGKLKTTPVAQLKYQGVALYGDKKLVNKFTGNLALLR